MRALIFFLFGGACGQFPGASLFSSVPWGGGGLTYGKPIRPSPFGYGSFTGAFNKPVNNEQYEDPIPLPDYRDSLYDDGGIQLPSKLPLQAPNGVVEIYNRVVDELIKKLQTEFKVREIDPMDVVIHPTPPGPVRVPGHMQKRPFRRPGAALYRSYIARSKDPIKSKGRKKHSGESAKEESSSASKNLPSHHSDEQSEEKFPEIGLSEENISADEEDMIDTNIKVNLDDVDIKRSGTPTKNKKHKKNEKKDISEEDDEEDKKAVEEGKKDLETLLRRYQHKHASETPGKYNSGGHKKKDQGEEGGSENKKKHKPELEEEPEDEIIRSEEEEDEDANDDSYYIEPGTLQSGGNRPNGGYYPQGGPPAVPAKPNAQLRGLSKMSRTSDVTVGIDARSIVITARMVVGPITVQINDSVEPMEKNVRATIPELEAEMILMERHGVVFLQRFTLDRAYGQDVEISVPKTKNDKKKKGTKIGVVSGLDPNHPLHPAAVQRFQTKMGAHVSMEVVKLLRSGNLRVNIMRTAQSSISSIKLPIKKASQTRKSKKKNKKGKRNHDD